jgi:hypothetical protein
MRLPNPYQQLTSHILTSKWNTNNCFVQFGFRTKILRCSRLEPARAARFQEHRFLVRRTLEKQPEQQTSGNGLAISRWVSSSSFKTLAHLCQSPPNSETCPACSKRFVARFVTHVGHHVTSKHTHKKKKKKKVVGYVHFEVIFGKPQR